MLRLEGKQIYLRDHEIGDLEALHAWLSDPVVTRYVPGRTTSIGESGVRLAESLRAAAQPDRTRYFFALVLKADGSIAGDAGFTVEVRAPNGGLADLGYFLLPQYWGHGYATEAVENHFKGRR